MCAEESWSSQVIMGAGRISEASKEHRGSVSKVRVTVNDNQCLSTYCILGIVLRNVHILCENLTTA